MLIQNTIAGYETECGDDGEEDADRNDGDGQDKGCPGHMPRSLPR